MAALTPAGKYLARGDCQPWLWQLHPGQAPGPVDPGQVDEFVQFLPGQPGEARAVEGLDDPPWSTTSRKRVKFRFLHQVGDVLEFQPEAGVRAVQPEAVHAFLVGQPGEGTGHLDALQSPLEQGRDQPLHHPDRCPPR